MNIAQAAALAVLKVSSPDQWVGKYDASVNCMPHFKGYPSPQGDKDVPRVSLAGLFSLAELEALVLLRKLELAH